ncbi:FHA domain-containing protein [Candidatus Latescibacterota bacterium]
MYLYILNGEDEGKRIELALGINTIGRSPKNSIVLSGDNYVSATHTEITYSDDDTLTITDKGSRNGTLLFGEPVTSTEPLIPGDIFQIGKTFLKCTRRNQERFFMDTSPGERSPEAVVVVDIVGSSKIAQMMGDSVAGKIKNLLKQGIIKALATYPAAYHKSTGDGFMLIYGTALPAVHFSITLLKDITTDNRKRGLHIRIGINYGETHKLPDNDRRGSSVDMAFRIESVSLQEMHQTTIGIRKEELPRTNRIFITENVQKIIASKPTIKTRCIGFFDLKGFNGRHKIFEVMV